jgi:hypothetical protein
LCNNDERSHIDTEGPYSDPPTPREVVDARDQALGQIEAALRRNQQKATITPQGRTVRRPTHNDK